MKNQCTIAGHWLTQPSGDGFKGSTCALLRVICCLYFLLAIIHVYQRMRNSEPNEQSDERGQAVSLNLSL